MAQTARVFHLGAGGGRGHALAGVEGLKWRGDLMRHQMVFLFAAFAAVTSAPSAAQDQPVISVLTAPGGRYAFGQISRLGRDQYMLDTQTGRLWQLVCVQQSEGQDKTCKATVLQSIDYLDDQGKYVTAPRSGSTTK
jgi:hypothetical protein